MVTVWIFFGSGGGDGGVAAELTGELGGTGAIAAGGEATGAAGQLGPAEAAGGGAATGAGRLDDGVTAATTDGGKGGLSPEVTGIVETTLGAGFACSMLIGSSSRETKFSVPAVFAAPAWFELAAWASPEFGITLLGALLALMIGGNAGSNDPPNMVR